MAHSHDRTLLASLGFNDPDKKNSLHDLGCQYLALPENSKRIVTMFGLTHPRAWTSDKAVVERFEFVDLRTRAFCEAAISKGEAQYKTTIGFADVLIEALTSWRGFGWHRERASAWALPQTTDRAYEELVVPHGDADTSPEVYRKVLVEVKVGQVPVTDIIRQLNLYREHIRYPHPPVSAWVVATVYVPSALDVETLKREGIHHIRLGPKFTEWAAAQQNASAPRAESEEF